MQRELPGSVKIVCPVGGTCERSGALAERLYATAIETVERVASAEVAEAAKLFENTFRAVNIALVNELALLCDKMRLNVWEVLDAAFTKPFRRASMISPPRWWKSTEAWCNLPAEKTLSAAGFPHVYIFRPAYIYPVQPRREPNVSYRLLRAIYPAFRVLFPNQVIRADDLARTMADAAVRSIGEGRTLVLENRDIRHLVVRSRAHH